MRALLAAPLHHVVHRPYLKNKCLQEQEKTVRVVQVNVPRDAYFAHFTSFANIFTCGISFTGELRIKYPDVTGDFVFTDLVKGGTGLGK